MMVRNKMANMPIPIIDPRTGELLQVRVRRTMAADDVELVRQMRMRYTFKRFDYGRTSFDRLQDLDDHRKTKPMSRSRAMYNELYGEEWTEIHDNARAQNGWRCERCGLEWDSRELHVHHLRPISQWIRMGENAWTDEHDCFGVKTRRPWHTEENLVVLCRDCHSEHHSHMTSTGERDRRLKPDTKLKPVKVNVHMDGGRAVGKIYLDLSTGPMVMKDRNGKVF